MSNVLTAPGFGVRYPTFSQNLSVQRAPPTNPSQPWGIPKPSVTNKFIEPMTNGTVRAPVTAVPFNNCWESNYSDGMPIFVNSKKTTPGVPSVLAGTPAVVNYYLEEGARSLEMAKKTAHKRKLNSLLEDYCSREHLYCDNSVEKFLETWRHFGYIYSILGKGSETGIQGAPAHGDHYVFNCTVAKTAEIINYWGHVSSGDRIGWTVGLKRNVNPYFYDPNGMVVGDSRHSPEWFLQVVPVTHGTRSHSVSHNRNWKDLENPFRDDIDFVYKNMCIEQEGLDMNMQTGEFTSKALDFSKEIVKTSVISDDFYAFGAYIPVGIVNKGSAGKARPSQSDLNLAIRSNVKAQTLGKIQVFLSC